MVPRTLRITIDVNVDGDLIAGRTGDGSGEPRPFSGWLGLMGALDDLVGGRAAAVAEPEQEATR